MTPPDESLRRRILIGLNKGEALHSLARQLFFGRLRELRDRALEDQMHRASCLHLLMAAIAAWNTIYLTEAFATLRRQGEEIAETTVAHIAPLGWEHINLIGKYQFAPQPGRSLENLRPLRKSEGGEEALVKKCITMSVFPRLVSFSRKGLTHAIHMCYDLSMRTKNNTDGQSRPTFTETARRTQLIECAIETIATLGYAQASLAHIARQAGISKGVIIYYFKSREELIEQVVTDIYTAAVQAVAPQIAAQPTTRLRLHAYIRSAVDYIGSHRMRMVALVEIALNFRTADGQFRYRGTEEWILTALEALLRQGQEDGEFRAFDLRVMAVTIRRAIDAVAPLLAAHPSLDTDLYARELVTLFDRATRKE